MNTGRSAAARRIFIALGVSVLLHAIALSQFGLFSAKELATRRTTLQVSLAGTVAVTSVPAAIEAIAILEAPLPQPQPETKERQKRPRSGPVGAANAPIPVKPVEPATSNSTLRTDSLVTESVQTNQSSGTPLPGAKDPIKRAEIEFEILTGIDRKKQGRGRHLYVSENGESFGLSFKQSLAEEDSTPGVPWQLNISGNITRQGLNPLIFEIQGALPERFMALKGVPRNQPGIPGTVRTGRMPDGILDRQSLLYQFMFRAPDLTGGTLLLSDGVMYSLYSYRFAGIESFTIIPHGEVRAIKLLLSTSESGETIELWLLPEMHYLPVKARYIDNQGVITEQMAISLDFN